MSCQHFLAFDLIGQRPHFYAGWRGLAGALASRVNSMCTSRFQWQVPLDISEFAAAVLAALTLVSAPASAEKIDSDKAPSAPTPQLPMAKLPDGKVDLGGKGVWAPIWVLDWADKKYVEEKIDVPLTPAD